MRNQASNLLFLAMITCVLSLAFCFGKEDQEGALKIMPTNHSRYRRSLYQFYQMISCATNNNPLKYNSYGCFCGLGGTGTPVDNLDRCCQKNDACYRQINLDKRCRFPWYIYVKSYERKDCTGSCDSVNDDCQSAICKCDSVASQCFAKNKINPVYEKYPERKCE